MESLLALVARTRIGDAAAKIELFARLRPYLHALAGAPDCVPAPARRQLDLSDVTQKALLRIVESLHDFHGSSEQEFCAWLKTIVRNLAIDDARKGKREVSLDQNDAGLWTNGRPVADDTSPSAILLRAERKVQLGQALERLPEDQRQAVRWRHIDNLCLDEIGRRLGNRSPAAAAQLIRRGMCRLNQLLSHLE